MEVNSSAEWHQALQQHMLQGKLQNRMGFFGWFSDGRPFVGADGQPLSKLRRAHPS